MHNRRVRRAEPLSRRRLRGQSTPCQSQPNAVRFFLCVSWPILLINGRNKMSIQLKLLGLLIISFAPASCAGVVLRNRDFGDGSSCGFVYQKFSLISLVKPSLNRPKTLQTLFAVMLGGLDGSSNGFFFILSGSASRASIMESISMDYPFLMMSLSLIWFPHPTACA